mmetsp:Transcript_53744/g.106016  ORF Transcript_53744/g.106016 Transcript_53744/m.106016 type:complete len:299 (-) Transcript_53744:129-1025(-)
MPSSSRMLGITPSKLCADLGQAAKLRQQCLSRKICLCIVRDCAALQGDHEQPQVHGLERHLERPLAPGQAQAPRLGDAASMGQAIDGKSGALGGINGRRFRPNDWHDQRSRPVLVHVTELVAVLLEQVRGALRVRHVAELTSVSIHALAGCGEQARAEAQVGVAEAASVAKRKRRACFRGRPRIVRHARGRPRLAFGRLLLSACALGVGAQQPRPRGGIGLNGRRLRGSSIRRLRGLDVQLAELFGAAGELLGELRDVLLLVREDVLADLARAWLALRAGSSACVLQLLAVLFQIDEC